MPDIDKAFVLARDFTGQDHFRSVNRITVPCHPRELVLDAFRPGDGAEFTRLLTGPLPTGEPDPRKLPEEISNAVAHLVNVHRKQPAAAKPGYLVQMVGVGASEMDWTLELLSARQGRFDVAKLPGMEEAVAARKAGKVFALKGEMDNLRIKTWHRRIHYTVNLVTFDRVADLDTWIERYGKSTLVAKDLHLIEPIQRPTPPVPWFTRDGWQHLPPEVIDRLDKDAKALVFPGGWRKVANAISGVTGPLPMMVAMFLWDFGHQLSESDRPDDVVPTQFEGDVSVLLCRGKL